MEGTTWKAMWTKHLEHKYAEHAERWKNETKDDRLVFCVSYQQMQDALDTLDDEPHALVNSAMTTRLQAMQKPLDEILEVFKGR